VARLKTLFWGWSDGLELDYQQRAYLTSFQNFCERRYPEVLKSVKTIHLTSNNSNKGSRFNNLGHDLMLKLLGKNASPIKVGAHTEWDIVCATIQWLGTEEGQEFLVFAKKDHKTLR